MCELDADREGTAGAPTIFEQIVAVLFAVPAVGAGMALLGVDAVLPLALGGHLAGEKGEEVPPSREAAFARGVAGLGRRGGFAGRIIVGHRARTESASAEGSSITCSCRNGLIGKVQRKLH